MIVPGLLCCTWEQFVLMVSSEWTAAMKVCIAMREVAGAVTPCSFTQVWFLSYAIRLINRVILKNRKVELSGEEFHCDCWQNNVDIKLIRLTEMASERNDLCYSCHTFTLPQCISAVKNSIVMQTSTYITLKVVPHHSKHPAWLNEEQFKGYISLAAIFLWPCLLTH